MSGGSRANGAYAKGCLGQPPSLPLLRLDVPNH